MKNVVAVTRGTGEEIEDAIKQKLEGIENSDNISHNDVHRFLQPKYPNEGFREMTNQWTGKLRERFDEADDFYRKVDYTNYDNHLRGIDFDKPVRVITEPQGNYVYQYCKIDNKGNPVIGDYFYRNQNIDVNLLGFDIGNRKMVRMKLTEPVEFLESTTSNIDDWFDSDKVFQGGEIQIFSPNTKNKVTEITIIK